MTEIFPALAKENSLVCLDPSLIDLRLAWDGLTLEDQKRYYGDHATILIEALPHLRNAMAHCEFELTLFPDAPLGAYELLIEVVSRLWPN